MALLRHIEQRPIIEDRSTSNTINDRKRKAWDEITASFNASYPDQIPRSAKQLKRSYEHIKRNARGMRKTSASVPSASLTQSYDPLVLPGPTPGPSSMSSAQFTVVSSTVYRPLFSPSVPVSQVNVPASPVIALASPNIAPASAVNAPDSLSSDLPHPLLLMLPTNTFIQCPGHLVLVQGAHQGELGGLNREHEEEMKLKKEMMSTQKLQQKLSETAIASIEKTHEKLNNSLDLLDSVLRKAGTAYDAMAKTYE
ncbi:putative Myb/SANT-like DNA-binding domain-containing protein 3, partial [Homarus americanus]